MCAPSIFPFLSVLFRCFLPFLSSFQRFSDFFPLPYILCFKCFSSIFLPSHCSFSHPLLSFDFFPFCGFFISSLLLESFLFPSISLFPVFDFLQIFFLVFSVQLPTSHPLYIIFTTFHHFDFLSLLFMSLPHPQPPLPCFPCFDILSHLFPLLTSYHCFCGLLWPCPCFLGVFLPLPFTCLSLLIFSPLLPSYIFPCLSLLVFSVLFKNIRLPLPPRPFSSLLLYFSHCFDVIFLPSH